MIITKMSNTLEGIEELMQEQLKILYNLKGFVVKNIQIKIKDDKYCLRIDVNF